MSILRPTSRRGKAIRNLVFWFLSIALLIFCVWWFFGDAIAGLQQSSGSKAFPRSENLGTRVSPEQAALDEMWRWSWIIATILIGAGFGILRKKGQHSNIGCLLASAGLHIALINSSLWLSKKIVLFLLPGGLYYFFSVMLTAGIIFFWVFRSFFKECILNKKIVPIDTIGVGSFLGRRLSILNKAVGGSINQLLPSFLGMSWENVDGKKLTYPLEREAGKTDAVVQCGSNGSEFPAHITGTVVVVCFDPKKSKTNPLSTDQMRLYALGALTVVLSDAFWTTVSQIRGNLKGVSDQALNTGTIQQRFIDSGYQLSSITITKVENPPSIEEAMLALKKQALDDQRETLNIRNKGPKMDEARRIFPTMSDEQLLRFIQVEEGALKGLDIRQSGGSGKNSKKRNNRGGGNPPVVVTRI